MPSDTLRDRVLRTAAPELPLTLLEITHSQLVTPARVVNDTLGITCNGNWYEGVRFRAAWPGAKENEAPGAQIAIDNISRDLIRWIDRSGGAKGARVKFLRVLRSNPDLVETQLILRAQSISVNVTEVTMTLGFADIWNSPAVRLQYRPDTHPAMF